jgi:hypothetical protein
MVQPSLIVFQTVAYWNPDFEAIGKQRVGESGPQFIAKDVLAVKQLIHIMNYQVVDIRVKVGEVDASDLIGTRLMPYRFDPNQN